MPVRQGRRAFGDWKAAVRFRSEPALNPARRTRDIASDAINCSTARKGRDQGESDQFLHGFVPLVYQDCLLFCLVPPNRGEKADAVPVDR